MSKYSLLLYLKNPVCWTELARRGTLSQFSTSIVAKHQKISLRKSKGATILVSSCGLKKSHYNSRVSLHEAPTNNPRTAQVGAPLKSPKSFFKYVSDTFVNSLSTLQCRKIPEKIRLRLEHRFSLT